MSARAELDIFLSRLDSTSQAYRSWGEVKILAAIARGEEIAPYAKLTNRIFARRKDINFIFITQQEYAGGVLEEIPPILDDQAQLLGVSVRVATTEKPETDIVPVMHALRRRYAAILRDGRSICLGATPDDAYVAAQLLEKTAKAFTEAKWLGGAKSINRLEAWAMQMYYQYKYAKEAKKNK
jgi:ribulose-5-phosphate 4-epimerase/fuculose-1-phosphate aldolase